jgi:hypothetical protein
MVDAFHSFFAIGTGVGFRLMCVWLDVTVGV